jgi:hypothetical protein
VLVAHRVLLGVARGLATTRRQRYKPCDLVLCERRWRFGRQPGPGATLRSPVSPEEDPVKKILLLLVVVALGAAIAKKVRAA